MRSVSSWDRWLLGALIALHPRRFRQSFGDEVRELHSEFLREQPSEARRMLLDLLRNLPGTHFDRWRIDRRGLGRARTAVAVSNSPLPIPRPEASMIDLLLRDCQLATRRLLRSPLLTGVAAITLALGIGGTTAIFSVVNGVVLEPLSAPEPERLMAIEEIDSDGNSTWMSYESFLDYQRDVSTFEHVAVLRPQSVNVTGGGHAPERIRGMFVSSSVFETFGQAPQLGRGLAPGEDVPGGPRTAVLSHGFWQRRYGGDPATLGETIELNNEPHTIVGVLAPDFRFPFDTTEAWISLHTFPGSLNRTNRTLFTLGRLADGVSPAQASEELAVLAKGLAEAHPEAYREISARAIPISQVLTGEETRGMFQILVAAVLMVLLIGAANVTNLQLAQATGRSREMAIRTAVGAGRRRLLSQLLIENLALSVLGGALGIALAFGGVRLLTLHGPGWIVGRYDIAPDPRVLTFALAISLLAGLASGLAPALRAARVDLVHGLQEGGRGGSGRHGGRLRAALVVAQVALAAMLVIGAGLLLRSFQNLQQVDVGFDREGLITLQFRLPANKYETDEQVLGFFRQLHEKVEALPGVRSVATAQDMPFTGDGGRAPVLADGVDPGSEVEVPFLRINSVSTDYFASMGIPLLQGRGLDASDHATGQPSVVITQEAAARLWPDTDEVIGRTVGFRGDDTILTVVGVAGDIFNRGMRRGVDPMLYIDQRQLPQRFATLAARVVGEPHSHAKPIQEALWSIDPDQPIWEVMTQDERIAQWTGSDRFAASLLSVFALVALTLAAIGIGGVIAYSVALRRRELGIRLSLGASRTRIVRLVLGQGLLLVGLGLLVGLSAAVALRGVMATFLFGVEALDPTIFALAPAVLGVVALLATIVPAWRAAWLDPVTTLRDE